MNEKDFCFVGLLALAYLYFQDGRQMPAGGFPRLPPPDSDRLPRLPAPASDRLPRLPAPSSDRLPRLPPPGSDRLPRLPAPARLPLPVRVAPALPVALQSRPACPRVPNHPVAVRTDGAVWCRSCDEGFFPLNAVIGRVLTGA